MLDTAPREEPAAAPQTRADEVVAHDSLEYEFTDPDRKQKLVGALEDMDSWLQQKGKALDLVGLLAGVVVDGELVKTSSYGFLDTETRTPVDPDSVFRIGSITKPMTAMAILKLRDKGMLSLDAPARDYLPELGRVGMPSPDARPITVRHLLMHTSGLPREGATLDDTNGKGTSQAAILRSLVGMQLGVEPGSRYQYSNFGYTLLGLILSRVVDAPYRDIMKEQLFEPLALESAVWDASAVPRAHLARPHKRDAAGRWVVDPKDEALGAREPGGGLYISGRDFARFLAWQLAAHPPGSEEPGDPVRRSTRRESHQMGRLTGFGVSRASGDSPYVANGEASFVGLSWHGYETCEFDHVVFHNGLVHSFASDAALLPEYGVGVFVFTNSAPADMGSLRRDLLERLRKSGGLSRRQLTASRAPRLEAALTRLLDVYNDWDPQKYSAMLSESHKRSITEQREREEFEEYRELHGKCSAGPMLHYENRNEARYLLSCQKARLEMALYLNPESGLIDGFVGHSSGVPAIQGGREAAERLVARLGDFDADRFGELLAPKFDAVPRARVLARELASQGPCELGELIERDGNRWQRFQLVCKKGPLRTLALHLLDEDHSLVDGFSVEAPRPGPCAEK